MSFPTGESGNREPTLGGFPAHRRRILVVDDEPLSRTLVTAALRRTYHVSTAVDGMGGYQLLLADPPDLAIVDWLMPRWDGIRMLKAARAHEELRQLPVLLLSGEIDEVLLAEIEELQPIRYLEKQHFSRPRLLTMIEEMLGQPQLAAR